MSSPRIRVRAVVGGLHVPSILFALVALVLLSAPSPALAGGIFGGYYTNGTSGGNVGLDWSSDLGLDYGASWGLPPYGGPWSGTFSSHTERDFGGYSGIYMTSAGTTATIPPSGVGLPAHLHFVTDLVNQNYSGYGIQSHSGSDVLLYVSGSTIYWDMEWSIAYTSDFTGNLNFDAQDAAGQFPLLVGVFPGGTTVTGSRTGSQAGSATNLYFNGTLYQGQATPGSGHAVFTMDLYVSDSPVPEPSTGLLLALAGVWACKRRR